MRRQLTVLVAALALAVVGCGGPSEDEACAPHGGVAEWDGEEGYCNGRDAAGDRIEIEKGDGVGEGVVVDLD